MPEAAQSLFLIVSALFPIVNPLGGSPIFLALTEEFPNSVRKTLSRKIAFNSFFLIVGSYLIGRNILEFFGISIPVVQVGGGLVVISTGWAMLRQREPGHHDQPSNVADVNIESHAFYPLTLPLTVGPGTISVSITLGANAPTGTSGDWTVIGAALIGAAIIALSVFLCYGFADRLARALGPTAMSVILRLSSFLLLCIGVQIMWNGVSALLSGL